MFSILAQCHRLHGRSDIHEDLIGHTDTVLADHRHRLSVSIIVFTLAADLHSLRTDQFQRIAHREFCDQPASVFTLVQFDDDLLRLFIDLSLYAVQFERLQGSVDGWNRFIQYQYRIEGMTAFRIDHFVSYCLLVIVHTDAALLFDAADVDFAFAAQRISCY